MALIRKPMPIRYRCPLLDFRRKSHRRPFLTGEVGGTGDAIRDVVVTARCVIYRILAGSAGSAFQSHKLVEEPEMIQQIDPARVDKWQQIDIQLAFVEVAGFILDAMAAKLFSGPFTRVYVALHFRDPVGSQ
jgi:hypothetical protein